MKMKKKYLLILFISLIVACSSTNTKEEKIKSAFKHYVQTNFDDPESFIEITKVDSESVLSTVKLKKMLRIQKEALDSLDRYEEQLNNQFPISLENIKLMDSQYGPNSKEIRKLLQLRIEIANEGLELIDNAFEKLPDNMDLSDEKDTIIYINKIMCRLSINGEKKLSTFYATSDSTFSNIIIYEKKPTLEEIGVQDFYNKCDIIRNYYIAKYSNQKQFLNTQKKIMILVNK